MPNALLTHLSLLTLGLLAVPSAAWNGGDAPITGLFRVNGKEAKLVHVSARYTDATKSRVLLVFSEKDASKENDPELALQFDRLGSGLAIKAKPDGTITSCQVNHSAMKEKGGFNSAGEITLKDLKIADGKIQGKLSTGGAQKAFDEVWEVNLTFQAKAP
jgi:hypothetical protein